MKTEKDFEATIEHDLVELGGQGRAKAMVVTRSRLHAVRYKLAFDEYIKEKGYADLKALVAFSGTVVDPDSRQTFTEVGMNLGIRETELRDKFATDEYQLLFDQVIADGKADQTVQERAQANTFENFALSIKDKIQDLMIERMDRNQDIVSKYLDEDEFKTVVFGLVAKRIYEELRVGATPGFSATKR